MIELTKKGQPHLHVVMGPVTLHPRCYGNSFEPRRFKRDLGRCQCMSHQMSSLWQAITGDSWIVHVVPVMGAAGAGAYLSHYLEKGGLALQRLRDAGFARRYSTSRRWLPPNSQVRLRVTAEGGWDQVQLGDRLLYGSLVDDPTHPLFDRVGNDIALALSAQALKRKEANFLSTKLSHPNLQEVYS